MSDIFNIDGHTWSFPNPKDGYSSGTGGSSGKDGLSAYEVAVANGFSGTEAEWLESLKGKDGKDGKDGTNASGSIENSILYDASGFDTLSSIDVMHEMLIGYNLGNALESYDRIGVNEDGVIDLELFYETLFGNPIITDSLINYISDVGIQAVRLPITWGNMIDPQSNTIKIDRLERVKYLVDRIIQNGMYCIINVHHDGSHKWKKIVFDSSYHQKSMPYFTNLWWQIGNYFKDYGYKLLFEPYNEVTDSSGSMTANSSKEAIAVTYAQAFINIIRSLGGNNANRFLVIPNYGGVSLMSELSFATINDSATDKLLLTTHSYPSGESASSDISNAKTRSDNLGIGVIIDEIGTMPADRYDLNFVTSVRENADRYGIATFWWDNGNREYNLIDRFNYIPTNDALSIYTGKQITRPTFSYAEITNNSNMPYYAIFNLVNPNTAYNNSIYLAILSQKPITSINTVDVWNGYYGISMEENGIYSIYTSDDNQSYSLIETQFYTDNATSLIGLKHLLYGSTDESYYLEGNYAIDNAPAMPVHCTAITVDDEISITDSGTIDYTIEPANCTDSVSIVSNNTDIIRVSGNTITVLADGTTTITITCGDITKDVTITATRSSALDYSLPSDYETTEWTTDTSFTTKFPYYTIVKDLVNDKYYALYSTTKATVSYSTYYNAVKVGWTGNLDFCIQKQDTPYFSSLTDAIAAAGGAAKYKRNAAGLYITQTETETQLTSVDEVLIMAKNYDD